MNKTERKAVALLTEHLLTKHFGRDLERLRNTSQAAMQSWTNCYRQEAKLMVKALRPILREN